MTFVVRIAGDGVDSWIVILERFARQLIRILPAEKSLFAITVCAVIFGALCWVLSKTLLAAASFAFDIVHRACRRKQGRVIG